MSKRQVPTSKTACPWRRLAAGGAKHKLRWGGTDYEARAGYHYPSHRDRSTLQPRLLSTPHHARNPPASCPDNGGVGTANY